METVEVLEKVLAGKRMSKASVRNFERAFKVYGEFSVDYPETAVEINSWLVSMDGYSDQSVRLWFVLLRSASLFMEVNYAVVNPFKGVDRPKVKKKERRYFTAQEMVKCLQACNSEFEHALIMTFIDSGVRVGELAGLRGSKVGDSSMSVDGKTGARSYRLDSRLCEVLRKLSGANDELVFPGGVACLRTRVWRICRRAGLKGEKLCPHTFRHSSASLIAENTKNVLAVKAFLQHDAVATSMIYIHDVEEGMNKGISPLKLMAEKLSDGSDYQQKRLPMAGSEVVDVNGNGDEVEVVDELALEMFPAVSEGVAIRPLLKTSDLEVIRSGFMALAGMGNHSEEVGRARELMRRMLRKVK